MRILWIAPASAGSAQPGLQPEDARAAGARRYISDWTLVNATSESATLQASFKLPQSAARYLTGSTPKSAWSKDPWAYDKAYLVFYLKDETVEQNNQWVADHLFAEKSMAPPEEVTAAPSGSLTAMIDGVPKTLHPFKTRRNQLPGKTRCYFTSLDSATKVGPSHLVSITLPIQRGVVFSGAYLDLPDQMPDGQER